MVNAGAFGRSTDFPVPHYQAATSDTSITATTATDITGATITFTCAVAKSLFITSNFDVNCTAFTSTTAFSGEIFMDGVNVGSAAAVVTITASGQRQTASNSLVVAAGVGSHTVKITGRLSAATLTVSVRLGNSGLCVIEYT